MVQTPVSKAGSNAELYALTGEDRAILKRMVEEFRNKRQNTPSRPGNESQDYLAPEVYIARPSVIGTGTGTSGTSAVATFSDMEVYRLDVLAAGVGTGGLEIPIEDAGFEKTVFSLPSSCSVILRDKFGQWIAFSVSVSEGSVLFCCGVFDQGSSVSITVNESSVPGVNVGDQLMAKDPCGEFYNTSGSACGEAFRMNGKWYIRRITCHDFVALCPISPYS